MWVQPHHMVRLNLRYHDEGQKGSQAGANVCTEQEKETYTEEIPTHIIAFQQGYLLRQVPTFLDTLSSCTLPSRGCHISQGSLVSCEFLRNHLFNQPNTATPARI